MPKDFHTTYPLPASVTRAESAKVYGTDFDAEFDTLGDEMLSADYFRRLFAPAVAIAEKYNIPLYCGEYGVIDNADRDSMLRWFEDIHTVLNELKIGRAVWNYKEMNFDITGPANVQHLNQLISYL